MDKSLSDTKSGGQDFKKNEHDPTGDDSKIQKHVQSGRVSESVPKELAKSTEGDTGIRTSLMSFDRGQFNLQIPDELDLTYISDRILVCGGLWGRESNKKLHKVNINQISSLINSNFGDLYLVWNLSSGKGDTGGVYNPIVFKDQVLGFNFRTAINVGLEKMFDFCRSLHAWLLMDKKNIALIHCDTGIYRTGLLTACYLCYSRVFTRGLDALALFSEKRCPNDSSWITPTTKRYVSYFSNILQSGGKVKNPYPLLMTKVSVGGIDNTLELSHIFIEVYQNGVRAYSSIDRRGNSSRVVSKTSTMGVPIITFGISSPTKGALTIERDVQIFVHNMKLKGNTREGSYVTLMSFCFHTGFIEPGRIKAFPDDMDINFKIFNSDSLTKIYMDVEVEARSNVVDVLPLTYENSLQKGLLNCVGSINKYHYLSTDPGVVRELKSKFPDIPSQLIIFSLERKRNNTKQTTELIKQLKRKGVVSFDLKLYKRSIDRAANKPGLSTLVDPIKPSTHHNDSATRNSRLSLYDTSNGIFESYLETKAKRSTSVTLEESKKIIDYATNSRNRAKNDDTTTPTDSFPKKSTPQPTGEAISNKSDEKRRNLVSLIRALDTVAMDADELADDEDNKHLREQKSPQKDSNLSSQDLVATDNQNSSDDYDITKRGPPKRIDSIGSYLANKILPPSRSSVLNGTTDNDYVVRTSNASNYEFLLPPEEKGEPAAPATLTRSISNLPEMSRSTSKLLEPIIEKSPISEALMYQKSMESDTNQTNKSKLLTNSKSVQKLNARTSEPRSLTHSDEIFKKDNIVKNRNVTNSFSSGVLKDIQSSKETRSKQQSSISDALKRDSSTNSLRKALLSSTSLAGFSSNISNSSRRTNSPMLSSLSSLSLKNIKTGYTNPNDPGSNSDEHNSYESNNSILNNYTDEKYSSISYMSSGSGVFSGINSKDLLNPELGSGEVSMVSEDGNYGKNSEKKDKKEEEYTQSPNEGNSSKQPPPPPPPPPSSSSNPPPSHLSPSYPHQPQSHPPPPPPPSSAKNSDTNNLSSQLNNELSIFKNFEDILYHHDEIRYDKLSNFTCV